jgi:hypothetical protein
MNIELGILLALIAGTLNRNFSPFDSETYRTIKLFTLLYLIIRFFFQQGVYLFFQVFYCFSYPYSLALGQDN